MYFNVDAFVNKKNELKHKLMRKTSGDWCRPIRRSSRILQHQNGNGRRLATIARPTLMAKRRNRV